MTTTAKPSVLIIDDDEDYLEILRLGLSNEFTILTIADFPSLKKEIEHMRPALILLDKHLGDTDAEDVIQFIRDLDFLKSVPIYLFSGSDTGRKTALLNDLEGFIVKPATFHEIRDMLRIRLNRR